MKMNVVKIAFAALAAVGVMSAVKAEVPAGIIEAVPSTMNYQGYLTDPSTGAKYEDGIYKFEFRIYDAISGGNCLWGGTYSAYVKEGYFNVMLGDRGADELMNMPTAKYSNAELWKVFWGTDESDKERYLAVTPFQTGTHAAISSPVEITPRQRLLTSPFAFRAERAHYAHTVESCYTNFTVAGKTISNGIIEGRSHATIAGNVAVSGNATMSGDVAVAGKLTRNNVEVMPIPVRGIIMWSDATAPDGEEWATNDNTGHWVVCDGRTIAGQKTPDLRGRFVVGVNDTTAGSSKSAYWQLYAVGATGGKESVALTVAQMPNHRHNYASDEGVERWDAGSLKQQNRGASGPGGTWGSHGWGNNDGDSMKTYKTGTAGGDATDTTPGTEGSAEAHENLPPYYALYYIMRVR